MARAMVSAAARSYFDELMQAGVRIWEYRARMLHSKTLLIDDHCAMVAATCNASATRVLSFEEDCGVCCYTARIASPAGCAIAGTAKSALATVLAAAASRNVRRTIRESPGNGKGEPW